MTNAKDNSTQNLVNQAITNVIPKSWENLAVQPASMVQIISLLGEVNNGYTRISYISITNTSGAKTISKIKALQSAHYAVAELGTSYSNKVVKKSQLSEYEAKASWHKPFNANHSVSCNANKINELRYIRVIGDKSYPSNSQYFTVLENKLLTSLESYSPNYMTASGLKPKETKGC